MKPPLDIDLNIPFSITQKVQEAMKPPLDIDLNISFSCWEDNEDINSFPDLNLPSNVEETIPSRSEFNIDLNQTKDPLDLDKEASCMEEKENETEVDIHEAQQVEVNATQNSETEHAFDQSLPVIYSSDLFSDEFDAEDNPETEEHEFELPTWHEDHDESEAVINSEEYQGTSSRRKFLSNGDRKAISHLLLQYIQDGNLKKGTLNMVASSYSVSVSVIKRIWQRTKQIGDVSHRRTKNCGRKRVQLDHAHFRQIPLSKRSTLRDLASALNMTKSTLSRIQKLGDIRRHSNAIKPSLKEENKITRLKFCLSMLENGTVPHDPTFKTMHNIVHIDEMWFYMTKKSMKYYLLPEEDEPLRNCKSKNFIGKVMFLVAVARPRFDVEGNETFSGRIGVFPFVTKVPARRTSVNRVAGTLETKPITSVNREVSKMFLIEKVIPAMKEKWPRDEIHDPIFIQQDNARCHISEDDIEFCQAAKGDGFDIRLMCQPPNSPDLNVLDLGFFSAIQALQYKESPRTIDELIEAVTKSFETFSSMESNKIFITLQTCMKEIMKAKGSNNYNIPHIKKEIMQREGQLPIAIKCDPLLVEEVNNHLRTVSRVEVES